MEADPVELFVPAHVTGFFSVHPDDDPARMGSRGAGCTLADGVHVTVHPAERDELVIDGDAAGVDPLEQVRDHFDVSATIEVETDVPLGAGFGVSGAIALGAAVGLNALDDLPHTENELVSIAHVAEVGADTGLGDVVAQARGGLPIRRSPGAPPHGEMDGIPARGRIEYHVLGELSTAEVLSGELDALNRAGERALERLLARPDLGRFLDASRQFARASGLVPEDVATVIADVEAAGGHASMAMLGRTVFATGHGLSDAGYDARGTYIDAGGIRGVDGNDRVFCRTATDERP